MTDILVEEFHPGLFENLISEDSTREKTYKIAGPFLECNIKNKNRRVYPDAVVKPQIELYQEKIKLNRSVGELNHPNTLEINPKNIALKIEKLAFETDNIVLGDAKVCSTPNGMIVRALIDDGIKLGVSSRGAGTVKNGVVQNDYKYIGNDIVWDPSAPTAFVEGIIEAKTEWVLENNILIEKDIEDIKLKLANIGKQDINNVLEQIFRETFKKISSKHK